MSNIIYNKIDLQNGRVIDLNRGIEPIPMFANDNNNNDNFKFIALQGIQESSPLSMLFFSKQNMDILQLHIRYEVWKRSNKVYIISNQSETELEIIMRAFYLQHSRNMNNRLVIQIKQLNQMIVEWVVPQILSEIKQYYGYLEDVQRLALPVELPQNVSSKGTKLLRSQTSTF